MYNMRYNAKVDGNQRAIIKVLEQIGCDVEEIKGSKGLPDLLVGFRGRNYLLEVKNPDGRNRLHAEQKDWHGTWAGHAEVVRSPEEAIQAVTSG